MPSHNIRVNNRVWNHCQSYEKSEHLRNGLIGLNFVYPGSTLNFGVDNNDEIVSLALFNDNV
jgi:hypothetical protein